MANKQQERRLKRDAKEEIKTSKIQRKRKPRQIKTMLDINQDITSLGLILKGTK